MKLTLKSHLSSNCLITQRQIARDNLAYLKNFKNTKDYIYSGNYEKKEFHKRIDAYTVLIVKLSKKISKE